MMKAHQEIHVYSSKESCHYRVKKEATKGKSIGRFVRS